MSLINIRDHVYDWLNRDSNSWADGLNGSYKNGAICTRAVPVNIPVLMNGVANKFNIYNGTDSGDYYSVWTNWDIDLRQHKYQIALDFCCYPQQNVARRLHAEGYEVRIFFRRANPNYNIIVPNQYQVTCVEKVCADLIKNHGFEDNTRFAGGQFDYVKVIHKPVTFSNIQNDLALYVGQHHTSGQHLELYIREIISVL